jgi:LPS export ABC transporter protein LptC
LGEIYKTMVIRLEWILISAIAATIMVSFALKFQDIKNPEIGNKELEFKNIILTEVNNTAVASQAFAKSGKQENGVLTLEQIAYKKRGENEIVANKGIYAKDKDSVILQGDVKIHQKKGFVYSTQEAIYNPKRKTFVSSTPFEAKMGENKLSGEKLHYDLKNKDTKSQKIHAIFYTKDKQ